LASLKVGIRIYLTLNKDLAGKTSLSEEDIKLIEIYEEGEQ